MSESAIGNRSNKMSGEERGWEQEAIYDLLLEKPNDMVGSQFLH